MPNLNMVICPGCGSQLLQDNKGCPDCGYENGDDGRLLTIAEILERPSYPAPDAMRLNDVSPEFLKAVVAAARIGALREAAKMGRSISNIADSSELNSYETKRAYRGVAGELECMVEREEKQIFSAAGL